ncbi:MAG: S9 family peptidase [Gemmatimonadales bacterium]
MRPVPMRRAGALTLLFIGSCAVEPDMQSLRDQTEIIPREILFGNPEKIGVKISPDGSMISYVAPVDGVLNIWVGPADNPATAQPITHDTGRGIANYGWAYTGAHIIYVQDLHGDENWRAYSVDLETGESLDLTPLRGVQARFQEVNPEFPEEVLVGLNDRDPRLHDLYRVNVTTGVRQLVLRNEGFERFVTDSDYNVRFGGRFTAGGAFELHRPTADGGWELWESWGLEDSETTFALFFDESGDTLYMQDSRGRNTAALVAVDLATGAKTVIAEDPQADMDDVMYHPLDRHIEAVAFNYDRKRWTLIDESLAGDFESLGEVADGDFEVISRTLDDRRWIVMYEQSDGPVRYYLYDRDAGAARFLFPHRSELADLPLAEMHPVIIESRDGLNLVSYLTLPVWSDVDGDARPQRPLPMVLSPHGGPWARDFWGYDGMAQWLANRGYAVLKVNFRGSTGFGKEFLNASTGEWAGKMHDDLIDGVRWAVAEAVAHPDSVAIMGGSFGGYATLVGMTFTPDEFACGVDLVGPSNIVTLFESFPPYWGPRIERWVARVGGDHRTEEGREFLLSRSPITYVDRISKPLLIGQGAYDPRVNKAESDQIVEAMVARGIPVTYLVYPDEGHGFGRPENRLSFFATAEAFLSRCLGGKVEAIGDDFEGSSITVPVGAEHVPGLAAALGTGE